MLLHVFRYDCMSKKQEYRRGRGIISRAKVYISFVYLICQLDMTDMIIKVIAFWKDKGYYWSVCKLSKQMILTLSMWYFLPVSSISHLLWMWYSKGYTTKAPRRSFRQYRSISIPKCWNTYFTRSHWNILQSATDALTVVDICLWNPCTLTLA